jgi:1-acyl-sn-glycerol-3-phosphate acyltransferase
MKKIIDYILGGIYMLYFGLLLVIFHPIQIICFRIFGYDAHAKSVDILNFFIVYGSYITGSTVSFKIQVPIPSGRPIIFIANHQSTFDIPGIIWFMRKYHPVFVSKKELAHGVPSISYNLRNCGAALIDRNDGKQAIAEILRLSKDMKEKNWNAGIYPEGTRSRTGIMKPFAVGGVAALLKKCPDAILIPIAVQNLSKFNPKGYFPLTSFCDLKWTTLAPIDPKTMTTEEAVAQAEAAIKAIVEG